MKRSEKLAGIDTDGKEFDKRERGVGGERETGGGACHLPHFFTIK
jgi:hypothetical protein